MNAPELVAAYKVARTIIRAVDRLVRVFWIFVFWKRRVKVVDVLKAIQFAADDPTIRNGMLSVPFGGQLLDSIDAHRADLDEFAKAFYKVTKTMKLMLCEARTLAEKLEATVKREIEESEWTQLKR